MRYHIPTNMSCKQCTLLKGGSYKKSAALLSIDKLMDFSKLQFIHHQFISVHVLMCISVKFCVWIKSIEQKTP